MEPENPIVEDLIAPCGMNCAVCSRYLAWRNQTGRSGCIGCRPRNQMCTYLFEKCTGINHNVPTAEARFCYECSQYPCKQIARMDLRYKQNYEMSVKANLESLQNFGVARFLDEQYQAFRCEKCGDLISVHNHKCFRCEKVTHLVESRAKKGPQGEKLG